MFIGREVFLIDQGKSRPSSPRDQAVIIRFYGDGIMREILVSDKMSAPSGLALDYINQRVYWTDVHMDHIESVDYNGRNRYAALAFKASLHYDIVQFAG